MKAKHRSFACIVLWMIPVLIGAAPAVAGVEKVSESQTAARIPSVMTYQGFLADRDGKPFSDGQYDITFSLYTTAAGGRPIWMEEHKQVVVKNGLIRVHLGNGTVPVPLDIPFDRELFLGIRIGGDPEMVPRIDLTAAPYSFGAKIAESVPDGSITGEKLAPNSVTDDKIVSVDWSKITGVPVEGLLEDEDDEPDLGGPPKPFKKQKKPKRKNYWHVWGNLATVPEWNYVGNADSLPVNFRTNNQKRMSIEADGQVVMEKGLAIKGDLEVGRDLWVKRSIAVGDAAADPVKFPLDVKTSGTNNRFSVDKDGRVRIVSDWSGLENNRANYPLQVDGVDQGIAVKLNLDTFGQLEAKYNNYVSFWDNVGMMGRIEGNNAFDQTLTPEYILFTLVAAVDIGVAIADLTAASTSANACAGAGAVACPPIPSLIVAATANLIAVGTKEVAIQAFLFSQLGVAYQSGAGDYAEWLERLDQTEKIESGDIVGVFGGKVTRSTRGAEQLMAISRSPIVLGNMPREGEEHLYEKVAFMGQVPVKVTGVVREGDYIIPSGQCDGTGIAVSPEMMTADEFTKVIGRAWHASNNQFTKYVNVAVGLNSGDVASVVKKHETRIKELEASLRGMDEKLVGLEAAIRQLTAPGSVVSGAATVGAEK